MEINVSNCQKKISINKQWIGRIASTVLKKMDVRGELSIVLVDNKYIRRLNRKYRHKDRATDVLSFQQIPSYVIRRASSVKKLSTFNFQLSTALLGDVVISVERAESQARMYGHSFKNEMAILIEHGILHLLGLTHKEMKKWKKK